MHRPTDDEVWEAVDAVIAVFDRACDIAPTVRERIAGARAARAEGLTWPEMLHDDGPMLLMATNELLDDLVNLGARMRRLFAQALYDEGMSMERIASTFGVTRQRVSALLHADPDTAQAAWTKRRHS